MNVVLSVVLGIVFVVFQTACIPPFSVSARHFDLLLPLVIYVSVFRPVVESISLAIVFGLVMDTLSGSPFGLYIITYVWLFLGVRGCMRLLDAGSLFLFPLILAFAMVLEHLLFSFSALTVPSPGILITALWALFTAPLFLILFNALFGRARQFAARMDRDGQGL